MCQKEYWELKRKRRSPDHRVIKAFVKSKIDFLETKIGNLSQYKLLDVGCGNGFFTYYFQSRLFTIGLDYSHYMLSINPCLFKVQGSVFGLPFKNKSYDIVFCSNLLHHLDNPFAAVREMARVSNSFLVLLEPNPVNPLMAMFCLLKREERRGLKFTRHYLRRIVSEANSSILEEVTLGTILPNKTPSYLLPLLESFNQQTSLGFYNLIIAKIKNDSYSALSD